MDIGSEKLNNTHLVKYSEVTKDNSHQSLEERTSKNETSSHSLDNATLEIKSTYEESELEIKHKRSTRARRQNKKFKNDSDILPSEGINNPTEKEKTILSHSSILNSKEQENEAPNERPKEVKRGRKKKIPSVQEKFEDYKNNEKHKTTTLKEDNDELLLSNSTDITSQQKEKEPKITETFKVRRGRKRKAPNEPAHSDYKETNSRKTPTKSSKISNLQCGKCPNSIDTYPSLAKFKDHAIREHGGLARPLGESQEFTSEEEIHALLKEAFSYKKQISCYKCMNKKFTSFGGLKMHLLTCGKSKEECDVSINTRNFDFLSQTYFIYAEVSNHSIYLNKILIYRHLKLNANSAVFVLTNIVCPLM